MLEELDKAKQQWGGSHSLIDRWLEDRQALLVNFCQMTQPEEQGSMQSLPDIKELNSFCQQLVDYMSLGHFEVYESIVSECKIHGKDSLKMAQDLYPEITKTTDIILAFNDKYSQVNDLDDFNGLEEDLSIVGEILANRIDLEDLLIETLHSKH